MKAYMIEFTEHDAGRPYRATAIAMTKEDVAAFMLHHLVDSQHPRTPFAGVSERVLVTPIDHVRLPESEA